MVTIPSLLAKAKELPVYSFINISCLQHIKYQLITATIHTELAMTCGGTLVLFYYIMYQRCYSKQDVHVSYVHYRNYHYCSPTNMQLNRFIALQMSAASGFYLHSNLLGWLCVIP